MNFAQNKTYFLAVRDAVLRKKPEKSIQKNAINHLLLGDSLQFLGEEQGDWIKFNSRKDEGWLHKDWITSEQLLEVNFVDIGQGDGCHVVTPNNEILLIDAGEGIGFSKKGGDHMLRFLNWRYNLRDLNSELAPEDTDETINSNSVHIDHAVISHPDLDHYYGFLNLFKNPKISFETIYHNGIIERSTHNASSSEWLFDLGRKVPQMPYQRNYHLWDTVLTHAETKSLIKAEEGSSKYYIKTLRAAIENNPNVQFKFLSQNDGFMANFTENSPLSLEVLAPLTETVTFKGETRECLKKLGNESITKNGHSIVFQLRFGKLKMMLGGDLNIASQDYLAQFYSGIPTKLSKIESEIKRLNFELVDDTDLSVSQREKKLQDLDEKVKLQELIISKTKRKFGTDIAKACHHGSHNVLDSFLKAIHPIATVISSGDNESHSHPRPDALGAYGKCGRGARPLIFSTELARSTKEFSYPIKFYGILKKLEERMHQLEKKKDKAIYKLRMERLRDSNIVRYGVITVRTDGEKVIIAQKLERSMGNARKWDIYELNWNDKLHIFESM